MEPTSGGYVALDSWVRKYQEVKLDDSRLVERESSSSSETEIDDNGDTRSAISILANASPAELAEAQLTPRRYRQIIKDRARREEDAFERIALAARLRGG